MRRPRRTYPFHAAVRILRSRSVSLYPGVLCVVQHLLPVIVLFAFADPLDLTIFPVCFTLPAAWCLCYTCLMKNADGFGELFAHSRKDVGREHWQLLEEHARNVARQAAAFAGAFKSSQWAELLGELHDLGKARRSFQSYLAHANGLDDVDYDASDHSHSGAGACWAVNRFGAAGRILAYCVAGHHAGLPDWIGGETPNGALSARLAEEASILDEPTVREHLVELESRLSQLPSPPFRFNTREFALWIRMLFSCLVDADFLDTEAFMDVDRASARGGYPRFDELEDPFFERLDSKQKSANKTEVNRIRAEIRAACEASALQTPGLFSLTVPTGGGKTLSAVAFALRHARKFGKRRIIYVIPYTSIIEQTADVLRTFLGDENVLEHHSNFDPTKETQRSRLASENWDAPVIVTTTVQFFESLYACKPSRCRKLHNIADSVVILDEVQLLPTRLLKPCSEVIKQLAEYYGTTLVLSTATQPNLPGLHDVREIIPPALNLYQRLKRTDWEFPKDLSKRRTWDEIADELRSFPQVLCVVNTRKDCRDLFDRMPAGTIHLSASMCGEHRSRVIANVKNRLMRGESVRVVSTQLVEAGVDIDFPVVYRAFTGLSSIAQSAGRCNREGHLDGLGRVVVFMPPKESPRGELRNGEYATSDLLHTTPCPSFESSDVFPAYFQKLQARAHTHGEVFDDWLVKDARHLQFQFREASAAFQMIDDVSVPVVVRYGGNERVIEQLRIVGPKRLVMRRLQRFSVNVPHGMIDELMRRGFIEEMHPGVYVQTVDSLYSDLFGLDIFREGLTSEESIL